MQVYSRRVTADCIDFLVNLGNAFNENVTATTLLQKWRSTEQLEPMWTQKRKQNNWTTVSLPSAVLDSHKFLFIEAHYRGRWSKYRSYEVCANFFKQAQQIRYLKDDIEVCLWDEVCNFVTL